MSKNTGDSFETEVFQLINRSIHSNEFLVCAPHIKLHRQKGYYSKDRDSQIKMRYFHREIPGRPR